MVRGGPPSRVSAESLSKAVSDNVERARAKYHDKLLIITGIVHTNKYTENRPFDIDLSIRSHGATTISVQTEYASQFKGFSSGDRITFAGTCDILPLGETGPPATMRSCFRIDLDPNNIDAK